MAEEYDPLDPPTFNAEDDNDDSYDPAAVVSGNAADDDDDDDDEEEYEPGFENTTPPHETPAHSTTASAQPSQQVSRTPSAAPNIAEQSTQPKTVGGFILEESDDEEDATPAPSQLNGTRGAQSGLGAIATSEAQDLSLGSEPTPDAVAASFAQQNKGLTGSTTVATSTTASLSAPVSSVTSDIPVPAVQVSTASAERGDVLSPSVQPSAAPTPAPKPVDGASTSQTTQSAPLAHRLPHDKVGQLEDRITDDPKADTDAWMSLIAHYKEKDQPDNARKVYERFLAVFPSAARVWLEYAHWEQDNGENGRVEQILGNSLNKVVDTKMWNFYLNFCRRRNPLINDTDGRNRTLLSQVFEVVLDKVGIDPDAGELWKEYIEFIKSGPGSVGGAGWQDMQKSDLLRKAYQRAVAIPHEETIKLWKEYDTFETSQNRVAGRKNLNEQGASYMTAKSAKTQLDSRLSGLDRASLPKLPPVYGCEGEDDFGIQVEKWQEWIRWEQADELVLKSEEDGAQYRKRVLFVLKQATMSLRFYPNIWYDAAVWCFDQGRDDMTEEGEKFLDEGIAANPESVLLVLKKADRVEAALPAGSSEEIIIQNGTKLDAVYEISLTALYSLKKTYDEREKRVQEGVQEHFANMTPEEEQDNQDDENNDDMDEDEKPKSRKDQLEEQLKGIKASFDVHRDLLKRIISAVWCAKMRAFRRIQGQGAPKQAKKGFRGVFAESRPRGSLTSDVYVVSALLEHHCYRDHAATKIFERGLKLFPVDEMFALEYIKHLVSVNDLTNAKVVFETTLTKILNTASVPPEVQKEKCRPLLGYMHGFESSYGDLAQIQKLEKRMSEMFPLEPEILRFGHRFEMPAFDPLKAQIVISATQTRQRPPPGAFPPQQPPPGGIAAMASPPTGEMRLGPHGPYISSPKRGLDDSDADTPSRKFMRGESPIKGAAGKRIATSGGSMSANVPTTNTGMNVSAGGGSGGFAVKNFVPGGAAQMPTSAPQPAALPRQVTYLLSILPNAASYNATRFDPALLVNLLSSVPLPGKP